MNLSVLNYTAPMAGERLPTGSTVMELKMKENDFKTWRKCLSSVIVCTTDPTIIYYTIVHPIMYFKYFEISGQIHNNYIQTKQRISHVINN
jgi:DNA-directed RNA polymerase subunit L